MSSEQAEADVEAQADAAVEEDGFREVTLLVTGGPESHCEREVVKSVVVPALREEGGQPPDSLRRREGA